MQNSEYISFANLLWGRISNHPLHSIQKSFHFYFITTKKDIWTPDIVLKNGVKKLEELGGEFYYLEVSPEG